MSENAKATLEILRKPQLTMQWYIIPLLVIVLYIVTTEFKQKNYNVLLGAAALWGMDLFNEIWNSIVFHATGFAPVWGTPPGVGGGMTSLQFLIGYNIEISFMFLIMGIYACKQLPEDKKGKILGINNRVVYAVVLTTLCVIVECFLNYSGVLTWEYSWWSRSFPFILWIIGYLPFFTMAFIVHDMKRKNQVKTLGVIYGADILLLVVFGILGWM